MIVEIEVNNKKIKAKKGDTILNALEANGIKVPTLCNMKDFSATGACRLCAVEVTGKENLVPACSYPVEEWMQIKTHSPRVLNARRTIVELLLSDHPDDCLYCPRNGNCELQDLACELNIRERRIKGDKEHQKSDLSSASIERDPEKCILCGRCVRVCQEVQTISALDFVRRGKKTAIGTAFDKEINYSSCINCGQCILVCPTGALRERSKLNELREILNAKNMELTAQIDSGVSVSIGEEFGIKGAKDLTGTIIAALRKIGFNKVYDTGFGVDMFIREQVNDIIENVEKGNKKPIISSYCPSIVQFFEQFYPDMLDCISNLKAPSQILAGMARKYHELKNLNKEDRFFNMAVSSCVARKQEAQKDKISLHSMEGANMLITSRELVSLIRLFGVDVENLAPEIPDMPFGSRSSAGKLSAVAGGLTEGIIRSFYAKMNDKELDSPKLTELRNTKSVREVKVKIGRKNYLFMAVNGIKPARKIIEEIRNGRDDIVFLEIMACPGGCVNGGGQLSGNDSKKLKNRVKAIYDIDNSESVKVAHKNRILTESLDNLFNKLAEEEREKYLRIQLSERNVMI